MGKMNWSYNNRSIISESLPTAFALQICSETDLLNYFKSKANL